VFELLLDVLDRFARIRPDGSFGVGLSQALRAWRAVWTFERVKEPSVPGGRCTSPSLKYHRRLACVPIAAKGVDRNPEADIARGAVPTQEANW
jgi:hypothetical protein